MFKHAYKHDAIASNPMDKVDAPKPDTKEKRALSDKEVQQLIRKLDAQDPYDMALLLCITCGLRRSEALAVSWNDLKGTVLDINKSVEEDSSVKGVKTLAGKRRIPIPENTIVSLWIRRRSIDGVTPSAPIVSNAKGERLLPHSVTAWWRKNRSQYGLEGYSIHELRHTYLTMLARQGIHPRVMQDLAGHATMETTMQIYSHVNIEQKIAAVSSLDGVLGG